MDVYNNVRCVIRDVFSFYLTFFLSVTVRRNNTEVLMRFQRCGQLALNRCIDLDIQFVMNEYRRGINSRKMS